MYVELFSNPVQWCKKTFLSDKQCSTPGTICTTDRQCRTHTINHERVYTHLIKCAVVNILYSIHSTCRNCWKHFPLVCRHICMSHPTNTFFIAYQILVALTALHSLQSLFLHHVAHYRISSLVHNIQSCFMFYQWICELKLLCHVISFQTDHLMTLLMLGKTSTVRYTIFT
jgi:hypothetical protein